MWIDSNDKIINILDNIKNTCFPAECPVCHKRTVHIFFYRHKYDYGGTWIWCSNCRNSSHTYGIVPEWWVNPDFVDLAKLTALPDYPEENKIYIDKWVNMLITDMTY